ncbi:hypothetical protein BKA93DRAFT_831302 [Sparassis latifolia]
MPPPPAPSMPATPAISVQLPQTPACDERVSISLSIPFANLSLRSPVPRGPPPAVLHRRSSSPSPLTTNIPPTADARIESVNTSPQQRRLTPVLHYTMRESTRNFLKIFFHFGGSPPRFVTTEDGLMLQAASLLSVPMPGPSYATFYRPVTKDILTPSSIVSPPPPPPPLTPSKVKLSLKDFMLCKKKQIVHRWARTSAVPVSSNLTVPIPSNAAVSAPRTTTFVRVIQPHTRNTQQ